MNKEIRLECDCSCPGHFVAFRLWDDEFGYMWATVVEADRHSPFWERLIKAVKYLWGDQDLNYEEVVLTKAQAHELRQWLEQF